jgi:hypothetical protein
MALHLKFEFSLNIKADANRRRVGRAGEVGVRSGLGEAPVSLGKGAEIRKGLLTNDFLPVVSRIFR